MWKQDGLMPTHAFGNSGRHAGFYRPAINFCTLVLLEAGTS